MARKNKEKKKKAVNPFKKVAVEKIPEVTAVMVPGIELRAILNAVVTKANE